MTKVNVSVILPLYNEGPTLAQSINKIVRVLKSLKKSWEIIFVEDKSTDATRKIIEGLVGQIKNTRVIYHRQNLGRGRSVADGIRVARGQICGYLDVDLEVSADYIPIFVEEIEKGVDMAVGRRFYEGGLRSVSRFLASKIYAMIVKFLLKIPIVDTEAGYKFAKRTKILPILRKVKDEKWFWDTEICARAFWTGLGISQIPVLFVRRDDKKSTVRLVPDTINYIVNLIRLKSQIPNRKLQTNSKSKILNSKLL